jgi:hypothetical protein
MKTENNDKFLTRNKKINKKLPTRRMLIQLLQAQLQGKLSTKSKYQKEKFPQLSNQQNSL